MKKRLFFSLLFFAKVALATILPLVVFVVPGVIFDKKLSTTPSLTVIGVILAIMTTVLLIRRLAHKATKKINQMN